MRYKLFLSDFDGTLTGLAGTVSEKNIKAIAAYRAAGGIFAVCTGRMLSSIRPRLKELGLDEGIVVAYQGAQIADIKTGTLIRDAALSTDAALEIIRFMEGHGLPIQIYAGQALYTNCRDELFDIYEKVCGVQGSVVEGRLSDMVAANELKIVKVLVRCEREERASIRSLLDGVFGEKYHVTCSSEWLVEVMPKDQTKAAAVNFLSEYYGIPQSEIAAIGDQENDIPMVAAAGGKFAVGNAVEALKKIATVVPSVDEGGVAFAITHYALGESI